MTEIWRSELLDETSKQPDLTVLHLTQGNLYNFKSVCCMWWSVYALNSFLRKWTGEIKISWSQASSSQLAKSHEVHIHVLGGTPLHEVLLLVLSTAPKIWVFSVAFGFGGKQGCSWSPSSRLVESKQQQICNSQPFWRQISAMSQLCGKQVVQPRK